MELGVPIIKRFTWVLENFSASEDETYYSRNFVVAGCHWRLKAYTSEDEYLAVYMFLVPGSAPPGWRRQVQVTLTLVNTGLRDSNRVGGGVQCYFDAKDNSWGFSKFLPLYKLQDRRGGFLDENNRLIIIADVHVLPPTPVRPVEPVKITAPPSCKDGNQASYASFLVKYQGPSSCQVAQETENVDDDASEEGTDDADTSEEGSDDNDDDDASSPVSDDDDVSSPVSDDGGRDRSLLNQLTNALENVRNGSSLDQVKSLEDDASQTVENGDMEFNTVASVSETSNSVLEEMQPVKETMDVNGFEVCSSQVESVRRIFERHPDIAVEFRAKNQHLRNACMNFLLSLIKTLCQSLEELSVEDLVEADIALTYLKDAGFKVAWLEKKLDQLKDNKEKERSGLARLQEIEEDLLKLKQKCSDLDALAEKEKSELSATRTALSFDDLVMSMIN